VLGGEYLESIGRGVVRIGCLDCPRGIGVGCTQCCFGAARGGGRLRGGCTCSRGSSLSHRGLGNYHRNLRLSIANCRLELHGLEGNNTLRIVYVDALVAHASL